MDKTVPPQNTKIARSTWVLAALTLVCMGISPKIVCSQTVTLPAEIRAEPKEMVFLPFKVDGGIPKWKIPTDLKEVSLESLFGPELAAKSSTKLFKAPKLPAGVKSQTFEIWAWNAKADKVSDLAICRLIVEAESPDPGPAPGPTPVPPTPSVQPFFLSVWRDTSTQTPEIARVVLGTKWREYVKSKGKPTDFRVYDPTSEPEKTAQFKKILDSVGMPAVVIQKPTGEVLDAIKLPASEDEFLAFLRKFGG